MTNTTEARVGIAGAGIAGLALARALRARDIPAVVFDRFAGPPDAGLALNLPGNAVRALALVGVDDALGGVGEPIRRREYRNSAGRLLFAVDEEAFWGEQAGSLLVRRRDLLNLLGSGLPAGTVRWNRAVDSVRTTPEGAEVVFAGGTVERYDLVVGADGVRSRVRSAMLGEAASRGGASRGVAPLGAASGGGASRGVEPLGAAPRSSVLSAASWRFMAPNPGVDRWVVWSGVRGTFLLIPAGAGEVYGFASATRGGAVDADPEWLRETFASFPDPVPDVVKAVLADPSSLYHSPIEEVRVPRWSEGRVVLIGDAAHATGPVWAQGAAMAVEDALVLADLLAAHSDWSEVGVEYERRRRPRVAHVQAMTDRLSRAAALPGWIRDMILPFAGPRSYRETYEPLKTAP